MFQENGCDKEGWAVYKALSGAYKYAITQTFAIPTIDDAERDKYLESNEENKEENNIVENNNEISLNEDNVEALLGNPSEETFENIFALK